VVSFYQILVDLELLADSMPKIKRSNSEPYSLHYNHLTLDDSYSRSPHTPIHHGHDVPSSSETFHFID